MANVNQRWILFFNFSRSCADLAETTAHHKLIDQKYGVYFIPNWKFDSFSSVKLYLQGLALSWSIVSCWPDPTNRNYSGQNRSNFRKKLPLLPKSICEESWKKIRKMLEKNCKIHDWKLQITTFNRAQRSWYQCFYAFKAQIWNQIYNYCFYIPQFHYKTFFRLAFHKTDCNLFCTKNFLKILQDINLEKVKLLGQNLQILGCIQFGFHIKKLVVIKTLYKTRASCKRTYFQG